MSTTSGATTSTTNSTLQVLPSLLPQQDNPAVDGAFTRDTKGDIVSSNVLEREGGGLDELHWLGMKGSGVWELLILGSRYELQASGTKA